jgi:alanyl-tRNA synthetase
MLKVNVEIAAFLTLNNYVWKMGPCGPCGPCGLVDEKKFPPRKNGRKKEKSLHPSDRQF